MNIILTILSKIRDFIKKLININKKNDVKTSLQSSLITNLNKNLIEYTVIGKGNINNGDLFIDGIWIRARRSGSFENFSGSVLAYSLQGKVNGSWVSSSYDVYIESGSYGRSDKVVISGSIDNYSVSVTNLYTFTSSLDVNKIN